MPPRRTWKMAFQTSRIGHFGGRPRRADAGSSASITSHCESVMSVS